jgi:hypothetical protein
VVRRRHDSGRCNLGVGDLVRRERGVAVLLMPAVRGVGELTSAAPVPMPRDSTTTVAVAVGLRRTVLRLARGELGRVGRMGCPSFDRVSEREIWAWCGRPRPSCAN